MSKMTKPNAGYPDTYYLVSNEKGGEHDGADESDDDPPRFIDRQQAIDHMAGGDEFHEEGFVAVYKLVEVIEVRQRRVVTSHKPAKGPAALKGAQRDE